MSISAGIGTLAPASLRLDLLCVALWGFGLGLMNIIGRGPGWLALQGSTALVIVAGFPATSVYAAWRCIPVLMAGAVQLAVVLVLRRVAPGHLFAPAENASFTVESILSQIRDMIAGRAPGLGHAVTLALARLVETLCGAGLLTLLMALLRPAVPVLMGFDRRDSMALLCIPAGELRDPEAGDYHVGGVAVRDRRVALATGGVAPRGGSTAGRGNRTVGTPGRHWDHAVPAPAQRVNSRPKSHRLIDGYQRDIWLPDFTLAA